MTGKKQAIKSIQLIQSFFNTIDIYGDPTMRWVPYQSTRDVVVNKRKFFALEGFSDGQ